MKVLVTGAAGFIGHAVSKALIARGDTVIGIDNLNDYYDVQLKLDRLADIGTDGFDFLKLDFADDAAFDAAMADVRIKVAIGAFGAAERPMHIDPETSPSRCGRGCPSVSAGG